MKPAPSAADTTIVQSVEYNEARAISAALVADLDRSLTENALKLPSLPEVALKIRNALANDDVSVAEIARLIGSDPALAARIVRIANSALFYRGSKPITSVSAAVSQLGHRMVRNVALSYASQQVFIGYGSESVRSFLASIWQHSVHVAALAHMLARVRTRLNPDDAFLAGLLHEVGKLYILLRVKDKIEQLASEAAFQSVVDEWHPRVGRAVIESWMLPAELADAVGEHQTCALEAPEPPRLTDVLAVANYLAENSEAACADEHYFDKAPSLGSLAMDKPTFDWLVRAGDVDVRLLMIAFGV
jgi:putative nucleotidyltransferase with HDIG domain